MTMAVRLEASTPAVTSSAVEAEPKPLRPARPVITENSVKGSISLSLSLEFCSRCTKVRCEQERPKDGCDVGVAS